MLKRIRNVMDSKMVMFSVLALAAIFAMALPIDSAVAQTSEISTDNEGEYKDGEREGKSCPFKNKTASANIGLNI
jgi:hypothetical protein